MAKLGLTTDKPVWLFSENIKEPIIATFKGYKENYLTSNGNEIPVFIFSTESSEQTLVSRWKLDIMDAMRKYGDETDNWVDMQFYIKAGKGKKMVLTNMEEEVTTK